MIDTSVHEKRVWLGQANFGKTMEQSPISTDDVRLIALEEGLRSAISLDNLRLKMLHEAVDWICHLTDLSVLEVRREIAKKKGGQVARNLATIDAVRSLIKEENFKK